MKFASIEQLNSYLSASCVLRAFNPSFTHAAQLLKVYCSHNLPAAWVLLADSAAVRAFITKGLILRRPRKNNFSNA
jgi:hypothetical protein